MKLFFAKIYFKVERVTKKDWEDAVCENCSKEFYPKEKYGFVWEGKYKGHLQLCEDCVHDEFTLIL